VLRDVNKNCISTPTLLRKELVLQFGVNLVSSGEDFTIGYYKGSCKLSVCSPADIEECGQRGECNTWCNGAKQTRKDTDSDEDVLPPSRKKSKRLDEKKINKWKSSHRLYEKNMLTTLPRSNTAEMLDVGTHKYICDILHLVYQLHNLWL